MRGGKCPSPQSVITLDSFQTGVTPVLGARPRGKRLSPQSVIAFDIFQTGVTQLYKVAKFVQGVFLYTLPSIDILLLELC